MLLSQWAPLSAAGFNLLPLIAKLGYLFYFAMAQDLLIGKSCLASLHQLCWDLDGKFSISPHGILFWLSCRIRVQSSNILVFAYSAGSLLGHVGPCTTQAGRGVLRSGT